MTITEINKTYNRIIGSLDALELKNAFDHIQGLMAGCRDYFAQDRLDELQNTYRYLLRYRMEGAKDPMQDQIYRDLRASAYDGASCATTPPVLPRCMRAFPTGSRRPGK